MTLHNNNSWCYSCNNIAANLSVIKPFTSNTYQLQQLTPHIMNPSNPIISDTLNWVKVSGCYTAQGGEEYLTIGNFFDNLNTITSVTTTTSYAAYYYVDDVLVEEITGTCVTGIEDMSDELGMMCVYPNPNNGTFNIAYTFEQSGNEFMLTDLMGSTVKNTILENSEGVKELNNADLNNGVYFYKITDIKGNMLFTGKLIINK